MFTISTNMCTRIDQPCSYWRGCKALKPIWIRLVQKLCSNLVKHLAQTQCSANFAMCYARHPPRQARKRAPESTNLAAIGVGARH